MDFDKIKCEICKKEFKNIQSLSNHNIKAHKLKPKEYYDKYLKKENEGICLMYGQIPSCKKYTKLHRSSEGYRKFCSLKCSNSCNETKEKIKKTNLEKYGVENPNINKEIIKNRKHTIKNNIINNPNYYKEITNKRENTNLLKYNVNNPSYDKLVIEKRKKTNLKKYGKECIFQTDKVKIKIKELKSIKSLIKINKLLNYLNLELLSSYDGCRELIKLKCLKCKIIYETSYFNLYQGCGKCPNCFPIYKSNGEIELLEFIKSIESSEIIENSKNIIQPYELDIYIPSKNISIEFNGLYWHSEEKGKDKNYHLNKTELCEKKNIKLIHIFEDEWILKQDIVKSRLRNILKIESIKMYDYKIEEISDSIKDKFLNKYHLDGKTKSDINLGLYYNNKLISVMTFLNELNINNWNINRFCNICYNIDTEENLLNYFKNNYIWKEIYYDIDRRWNNGNLYYNIGFELYSVIEPRCWYIKNGNYKIKNFELKNENYYRIWDCGYYRFRMSSKICIN